MKLAFGSSDDAAARSWVRAGEAFAPGSSAHVADELRAHLLALGPSPRTSLVRRVTRLLGPVCPVDGARVEETSRMLERRGDILSGAGGAVAPGPLRLVEAHGGRWLVIGCLPTTTLRRLLPEAEIAPGVGRSAHLDPSNTASLAETVSGVGGRLLSTEDWAGLSRTPAADAAWLTELEQRLSNQGDTALGTLTTRWDDPFVYAPSAEGNAAWRWHRRPTTESSCLARSKQSGTWWAYGWGTLRGPGTNPHPFLPLTRDEARRTELALDRTAHLPRSLTATLDNGLWWLTLDVVVPIAEYRYLMALATRHEEETSAVKLGFEQATWERAAKMLEERLGLRAAVEPPRGDPS